MYWKIQIMQMYVIFQEKIRDVECSENE